MSFGLSDTVLAQRAMSYYMPNPPARFSAPVEALTDKTVAAWQKICPDFHAELKARDSRSVSSSPDRFRTPSPAEVNPAPAPRRRKFAEVTDAAKILLEMNRDFRDGMALFDASKMRHEDIQSELDQIAAEEAEEKQAKRARTESPAQAASSSAAAAAEVPPERAATPNPPPTAAAADAAAAPVPAPAEKDAEGDVKMSGEDSGLPNRSFLQEELNRYEFTLLCQRVISFCKTPYNMVVFLKSTKRFASKINDQQNEWTALNLAIFLGNSQCVDALLMLKPDVSIQTFGYNAEKLLQFSPMTEDQKARILGKLKKAGLKTS